MYSLIIADTSCLILLEKIDKLELLKDFYSEITITGEIKEEYGEKLPNSLSQEIQKLKLNGFRISEKLVKEVLEKYD